MYQTRATGDQDGNFPYEGGSPRRLNPNGVGMGQILPMGMRVGAQNVNRAEAAAWSLEELAEQIKVQGPTYDGLGGQEASIWTRVAKEQVCIPSPPNFFRNRTP
jgi:hypothetical protein